MTDSKKKIGECTVGCERDVLHLLVLISGTTDPINVYLSKNSWAVSYNSPHQYWDKAFYDDVKALVDANVNAKLFDFHGWSGDNSRGNREVAGRYLVNRLVGANGEKAFYQSFYQKKTIHFHLIGHSHGGNVINEMTKQMAALGAKWPATWKVKSFTYLSTPFFKKLHQVNVGGFVHAKAEVLNVINKYDMTQRMLADFSLFTLSEVFHSNDFLDIKGESLDSLMAAWQAIPTDNLDDVFFSDAEGQALYVATRRALDNTIDYFNLVKTVAVKLNQPVTFPVDADLANNNTVQDCYKILSDQSLAKLNTAIDQLILAMSDSNDALSSEHADFSRPECVKAISPVLGRLGELLAMPAKNVKNGEVGVLWQTVLDVLSDAIEDFDDTVEEPTQQFSDKRPIEAFSVSDRDSFDKHGTRDQKSSFKDMMTRIKNIESNIKGSKPDNASLLDLLLTLLAHAPSIDDKNLTDWLTLGAKKIGQLEYLVSGEYDAHVKRLRYALEHIRDALLDRSIGSTEIPSLLMDIGEHKKVVVGSLLYFLLESHSTSRRVLHPEVKKFLLRMMGG